MSKAATMKAARASSAPAKASGVAKISIARARQDVPALLDEVERLRTELRAAKTAAE
jgi:hypothetical protein